ncbi:MAG: hypothetical protein JO257_00565 [Deltaproteobacteria bacterium]|nr:hypothetical protein [Deltaproteobacteria bacterium]
MTRLSIGVVVVLGACAADEHAAVTSNAITSGTAIDYAEDWQTHWYAPDTGQRGPNTYSHSGDYVYWAGDDSAHPAQYEAVSDCSYFVDMTMEKAYAWTPASLAAWLCPSDLPCTRPLAKHYYNAVMHSSNFSVVPKVAQVQRGDLIAVLYNSPTNDAHNFSGTGDTGHVMWVDSAPRSAGTATDAGGATIYLYDVDVIDSSSTYHYNTDSRYTNGNLQGIGKGTVRLIAYADNDVAGYRWSTLSSSTSYINGDGQQRWTVVGRYSGPGSGSSGPGVGALISQAQFDQMFPPSTRVAGWDYNSFVVAAGESRFAGFASTGDTSMQKRELAAFLANVAHETGQLSDLVENTTAMYCDSSQSYGCPSSYGYKGRGPLQLSWNYNYHDAGAWLGIDLLNSPTQVGSTPSVGWETSLWFWMQSEGASYGHSPMTSHAAMTSGTTPAGFYQTIRIINGDLECGQPAGSEGANERADRVSYYNSFVSILGTTAGTNSTTYCP